MRRDEALAILRAHRAEFVERFGVKRLALFGSTARDEAREDSDVDVLVAFVGDTTFDGYFDLKEFLERELGHEVDLVTDAALRREIRPYVEKDAVDVA